MEEKVKAAAQIARTFRLPLNLYHQTVTFRINLIDAGFTTEPCHSTLPGACFRIYGQRHLFHITLTPNFLSVVAQRLDSEPLVRIFHAPGLPDSDTFRRVFGLILDYDAGRPLPLRKARSLGADPLK